jgi:hypothetical protein
MTIKTLLLAGVLSLAAIPAVHATEGPPPGIGGNNGHASAAPACGYECPILAGDTGPGGPGDDNGRSGSPRMATDGPPGSIGDKNGRAELAIDIHSMMAGGKPTGSDFHAGAVPTCGERCPVLAGDGGPSGAGDNNGRSSAALSQSGGEYRLASIKAGQGDF